ncbi:MAG TPA: hypothetical protein EYN67_17640, partial [Flavobacteriales bacterium]|nr:hypothetical protein [Flavobacteriales bacterium]
KVLVPFETSRTLSKNINTQMFQGSFDVKSGENVDVKRPTDWAVSETADGDLTAETESVYITGKATATVQDQLTVFASVKEFDEALKDGGDPRFFQDMAQRLVTKMELKTAEYMARNTGLLAGTVGTAVSTWDHVAEAGAVMEANGVPKDGNWKYVVNPFTQRSLASDQRSLGGETGTDTANERAMITKNFAGLDVMTGTTLTSYLTGTGAGRAGTVVGTPVATYEAAKDTMTQVIGVTGFQANLVVAAGETVSIAGRFRLNLATREPVIDETGNQVVFTGTVTNTVTLDGSGAGNLVITGPALFEANGQYNTVDSAIAASDVITLGGAAATRIQPNLFFHRDAFVIAGVPMDKLDSTDTLAQTKDGIQLRVSKGSDFTKNTNKVRIDLRFALGTMNPFLAGKGFGA